MKKAAAIVLGAGVGIAIAVLLRSCRIFTDAEVTEKDSSVSYSTREGGGPDR